MLNVCKNTNSSDSYLHKCEYNTKYMLTQEIALPVIRQRQICHIIQSLEGLRPDMTDVVSSYKEVSRVSRDASRYVPQIFVNTFYRQRGF